MLFPFFRHQLQPERPTISSTVLRTSENGQMDIGGSMRIEMVGDVSGRSVAWVIIVKERSGGRAKKA